MERVAESGGTLRVVVNWPPASPTPLAHHAAKHRATTPDRLCFRTKCQNFMSRPLQLRPPISAVFTIIVETSIGITTSARFYVGINSRRTFRHRFTHSSGALASIPGTEDSLDLSAWWQKNARIGAKNGGEHRRGKRIAAHLHAPLEIHGASSATWRKREAPPHGHIIQASGPGTGDRSGPCSGASPPSPGRP